MKNYRSLKREKETWRSTYKKNNYKKNKRMMRSEERKRIQMMRNCKSGKFIYKKKKFRVRKLRRMFRKLSEKMS